MPLGFGKASKGESSTKASKAESSTDASKDASKGGSSADGSSADAEKPPMSPLKKLQAKAKGKFGKGEDDTEQRYSKRELKLLKKYDGDEEILQAIQSGDMDTVRFLQTAKEMQRFFIFLVLFFISSYGVNNQSAGYVTVRGQRDLLLADPEFPWVEGEEEDEHQRRLIGKYTLVPNKWINGHGVWHSEGGQRYLYLAHGSSGSTEWWISESEEDMEAGAARGLAMVKGGKKALTPMHAGTTGWKVRANGNKGTKGKAKAGSASAGFVGAPELKARGPGQHDGDHFTQGISVQGVKLAFRAMGWDKYERDEDGLLTELRKEYCPYNKGPANGYDMCALVKRFIKGKGQTHLSFVEAVKVLPELAHIRAEVGVADGFYSHVQAEAVKVTEAGLAEAAERYADVLREDREGTRRLRRAALVAFFEVHRQKVERRNRERVDYFIDKYSQHIENLDNLLQGWGLPNPDLASLRASKPADEPTRFFLDYLCVRQCIAAADFSTERVVRAIATIGITVVELGADWRSESALLRRLFCVIELFATVKAGGRLLVVGPAFEDPKQVQELLQVATSKERSAEVMDSRDEEKTRCRFPDEAKEIRAYIEGSVGYVKLDRQVLSAIGVGCMDRVQAQMEAKKRQDGAADMMYGLAEMLFEAEVNKCVCVGSRV